MGARGSVFANLALVAVSLVAAFVLGEVVLRVTSLGDRLGWNRIPPVAERIGAFDPTGPGPAVVGLGDSFTEYRAGDGQGNYLSVMAARAEADGRPPRLVNLGRAGYDPASYRTAFNRFADYIDPDLVIVGLFLGNDVNRFGCSLSPPAAEIPRWSPGTPFSADELPPPGAKAWLKRHSIFANVVWRLSKRVLPPLRSGIFDFTVAYMADEHGVPMDVVARRLAERPDMVELARADAINPWDLAKAATEPGLYRDVIGRRAGTLGGDAVAPFLDCFVGFVDEIRATGARVAVLLIPSAVQVDVAYHGYFRDLGFDVGPALIGSDTPLMRAVTARLAAAGIPALDLIPVLRESGPGLYIPMDTHLNAAGQRVVGRALYDFLAERGLLRENNG